MRRSWRLLGLVVLAAVICLAAVTLLRPAVHEAEMAGGTDSMQETSEVQQPKPDTAEGGPQILVLNYHKVSDEFLSLAVAPADFDWQMRYLKEHGYHAITPDELYDAIEGTGTLPDNLSMTAIRTTTTTPTRSSRSTASRARSLLSRASSARARAT